MQLENLNCEKVISKAKELGCTVLINEELKKHTSFKVGGACDAVISIKCAESASVLFALCNRTNTPYLVLGKGSNMLIDDAGFDGIVFLMGKDFAKIRLIDETTIECEAGTPLAKAVYFAYQNGLTGLEFAWGIPGTVGGAVFMNAGAYGGEISDVIISTEQLDKNGEISTFQKNELDLSYRHSVFNSGDFLITKAVFRLKKGDKTAIRERMDYLLFRRKDKQPLEYASAGSTFMRPEGNYASLLIEQCGLKGLNVGDAEVSTKHSGFIVNKGNASFKDITFLIEQVKEIVCEKTGYKLECEVRIISSGECEKEL